jgi:hypothetical protein
MAGTGAAAIWRRGKKHLAPKCPQPKSWLTADKLQPAREHQADQSSQQPASRKASGRERRLGCSADMKKVSNCEGKLKPNVTGEHPADRRPELSRKDWQRPAVVG